MPDYSQISVGTRKLSRCGLSLLASAFLVMGLTDRGLLAQSAVGAGTPATPAVTTMVDDSDPGWMWKGMTKFSDPSLYGGAAHAGGPGSFAIYTFNGTGVDVIGVAGQSLTVGDKLGKVGSARIMVDGNSVAAVNLIRPAEMFAFNIYTVSGLPMGNHVLEVSAEGGWIAIDCLRVHQDKSLPTVATRHQSTTTTNPSPFWNEKMWIDGVNTYITFNFSGPFVHFRTYWDTDLNPATGYSPGAGIGADYLVEDTTLYKSTANGVSWSWAAQTAVVTSTITGNQVTITVPGCPPYANVLVQALDANWKGAATDTNVIKFNSLTH